MYRYYVDGSSPLEKYFPSAYAVFKGGKIIRQRVLNENLNVYEIEFLALLDGLILAEESSIIFSDNKQIVMEVNDKKKPKNKEYVNSAKILMKEKNIEVIKINRKDNLAGIYLEQRLKKLKKARKEMNKPRKPSNKDKKIRYGKRRNNKI